MKNDLLSDGMKPVSSGKVDSGGAYSAKDIEVLEGLEPVRRRPGMYIGGTDSTALHHLVAELIDNSMDEAVAGHASRIEVELSAEGWVQVRDNGRGIPVDPHPKFPQLSALEVILTQLHSGGKFSGKTYATAGGLHGVGLSVVNALASRLEIEVARNRTLYRQTYQQGKPDGPLEPIKDHINRRGTMIRFQPDPEIFGTGASFDPARLFRMARSKAYLFQGVEIRWRTDAPDHVAKDIPPEAVFHFPGGLRDFLDTHTNKIALAVQGNFAGSYASGDERVEWAIAWPASTDGFFQSYCNTVPTPQGGSHETALKSVLARGMRAYGTLIGNRQAKDLLSEDITLDAMILLSVFIRDPQFQGQTKERLNTPAAGRLVELAIKDRFDHWLAADPARAQALLTHCLERMEIRLAKRRQKDIARASPTRRLPLPGKLADCTGGAQGSELFLVEGDSAGGSAKQARNRQTQAILPLKGKILNVASASAEKLAQNQEIKDLLQALGVETGPAFRLEDMRYERVIIMTDADVDGAHIAALLMTFFFQKMPDLVRAGRLYLAKPPLYRLSRGDKTVYAGDDQHRDKLLETVFKTGPHKHSVDISRFKGLGEMLPRQLRDTTMDPEKRQLIRVHLPDSHESMAQTSHLVDTLMGRKPEMRLHYIQSHAELVNHIDI